jgi:hypothetical protein
MVMSAWGCLEVGIDEEGQMELNDFGSEAAFVESQFRESNWSHRIKLLCRCTHCLLPKCSCHIHV